MRMFCRSKLSFGSQGPQLFDATVGSRSIGFPEAVFPGVDMEWLLGDEDVWSVELEYRLKRAITFYPSVGSRSNFYKGFQRLFSLG
jgi:hypothetical protein